MELRMRGPLAVDGDPAPAVSRPARMTAGPLTDVADVDVDGSPISDDAGSDDVDAWLEDAVEEGDTDGALLDEAHGALDEDGLDALAEGALVVLTLEEDEPGRDTAAEEDDAADEVDDGADEDGDCPEEAHDDELTGWPPLDAPPDDDDARDAPRLEDDEATWSGWVSSPPAPGAATGHAAMTSSRSRKVP